ncbi:MAG: chain-length determining protein [Nitrospinaceae bacterium]|nr:MAG: chain-length determining protein [Nitrospinaceae bacterium]
MNQNNFQQESPAPNFSEVFKGLKKRKFAFLGIIFLFTLLGLIYVYTAKPVYQADSIILIGTQTSDRFAGENQQFAEVDPTQTEFYKTQYALLQSRSLVRSVIEELNLVESEEFKKEPPLIDISFIKSAIRSIFESLGLTQQKVEPEKINNDPEARLVKKFMERLKIYPISKSHVVRIAFQGYDPVLIAQINNTFLDLLIKRNISRRGKVLDGSEKWMSEKLLDLKEKMQAAEVKLANFRKKNNIIDFKKNREISSHNLSRSQEEIRRVKSEKLRLSELRKLLLDLKRDPVKLLHTLPDNLKTSSANALISSYANLVKEYEELTHEYSTLHPKVQIIYQKMKAVEARVPEEIDRLISSINIDYKSTVLHEQSLENEMHGEKNQIMKMDNQEFIFNALKDEFETNKILHNDLLKRFKQVDIAAYSSESSIQIVDDAEVPFIPIKPRKAFAMVVFFISGVIGGSLWVMFLERVNKTMITVEDVIRQIPFPFLGATGIIGKRDLPLPVANRANAFLAEEFRTVKTNLMLNGFVEPHKVLMVTSSTPKEGKTTVLTNLAVTFAQENKRVLVIEGDLLRPKVAEILKTKNRLGLLDILESPKLFQSIMQNHIMDGKKIDNIFVKSSVKGVYVLPRGNLKSDYPDMLNYGIFEKLLNVTRKIFDVVLIDTPPALAFSYVSIAAQLSDGVLFVIGSGMKDKALISRTLSKLSAATSDLSFKGRSNGQNGQGGAKHAGHRSRIFGVVLNKVKYQRDEYYEYHRKYFKEYYSIRDSKAKKPLSVE